MENINESHCVVVTLTHTQNVFLLLLQRVKLCKNLINCINDRCKVSKYTHLCLLYEECYNKMEGFFYTKRKDFADAQFFVI